MAISVTNHAGHPLRKSPKTAGFMASLGARIEDIRVAWSRHKTERLIESLPADLRKDLGWPSSDIPAGQQRK